ncbi:hypothetical protein NBC2815_03344 [Xanthomonas fragariae]|nr:hypothetical protein NBC2815_03344 [Xanthomonas fragariae]
MFSQGSRDIVVPRASAVWDEKDRPSSSINNQSEKCYVSQ